MPPDAPDLKHVQPVRTPPIGTAIQIAADLLMELVAEDCAEARHDSDVRLLQLTGYIEDYKRSVRASRDTAALKLASAHRQIQELEHRFSGLQELKRADELMLHDLSAQIQSLQQERMYLHAELSASSSQNAATHAPADLISDLARYGIMYCGQNSVSFGEQWLQLWNQYLSEDPHDPGLSPNDRITPKELIILLDNFSSQVRRDRSTIESQQEIIASLQKERACLFDLYNKDPKQHPYPAAMDVDVRVPISQLSRSYAYSENQGNPD